MLFTHVSFQLDHVAPLKNDSCLVNQSKMVTLMLKHHDAKISKKLNTP